jgi:hypothetical protein
MGYGISFRHQKDKTPLHDGPISRTRADSKCLANVKQELLVPNQIDMFEEEMKKKKKKYKLKPSIGIAGIFEKVKGSLKPPSRVSEKEVVDS